ncbi:MAG: hypothetical protein ASARMPRED_008543 [Alectoria sarmentosa]|nr:MAG: hypothetical protein ASARMPRED_008543 [Alectoria sarmentosa]
MQFPSQELMTKDNMTIHVEAVALYTVDDLLKALCDIEDGDGAVSQATQVRAISGHHDSTACQDAGRTRVQISDCTDLRNYNNRSQIRDQLSRAAFDQVLHDRDEAGRNVLARTFSAR